MSATIAFDIGYASIGWCVLAADDSKPSPRFLGTGVVTFPTDDCLASKRRDLRRTRRHIRSTRQRIERLKLWLQHKGILSREELNRVPGKDEAPPFLLAAAALQHDRKLTAWELWCALRWYAHNRGYDGNSLWSREEVQDDDTEKETNAKALMREHGTTTMCGTVCACLGLNPAKSGGPVSSSRPYKTLNAAYPRDIVRKEVSELLQKHAHLLGGNPETLRLILKHEALTKEERAILSKAGIKLSLRYHGGLLFGQLVPRFDNRIISRCPVTWAQTYDEAIQQGETGAQARKLAEKYSKVPAAKSKEFLEYRFARVIANLKAGGAPISAEARRHLFDVAREQGGLKVSDLRKELAAFYPNAKTNVSDYFTLHPDSAKQLVIDPVLDTIRKSSGKTSKLGPIWNLLSEETRKTIEERWRKCRTISLAEIIQTNGNSNELLSVLEPVFAKANKPIKGKRKYADIGQYLLRTTVSAEHPTGRAPYARPVLKQVVEEVLLGYDPTRPARKTSASDGEAKPQDGILYCLQDPNSRVNQLHSERPIDQLTNNHLVRHRMLVLDRLVDDIAFEFDLPENPQIVVEVARELKEFSGKTAKEIAAELNSKLKDFKSTVAYLEKNAPDLKLSGSLIRKARIAMDMDWQCPFTGDRYDAYSLGQLEREHIIPYASRNTNALHALVLTWPEVNRMKGKRSALQFIEEEGGKPVAGRTNLTLFTRKPYEEFVGKLKVTGHDDDRRRQKARKALLLTSQLEEKELGFTDGQLTQTSQLMKLAMRGLKRRFPAALIDPVPGPITAEVRKGWNLTGTLSLACPEVLTDETDEKGRPKVRPKDEIRNLTHLHHALDAATLALIVHYFPFRKHGQDQKGVLWKAMLKRNKTPQEVEFLCRTGLYKRTMRARIQSDGSMAEHADARLVDLPAEIKNDLSRSLAEGRVMQHVPSDRSGVKAELTTWGVLRLEGEGDDARVHLRQRVCSVENGRRKIEVKPREERAGKLLGVTPKNGNGKLKAIKGAMIIGENYGLALDPQPAVIPFHDVSSRLAKLRKANGGKPIRVLRNGMLIHLAKSPARSRQDYSGVWRIVSIKNNKGKYLLDMIRPDYVAAQNGVEWSGMNKTVEPLLECGLSILPQSYTGHAKMGRG